jgi:hypothetical protein
VCKFDMDPRFVVGSETLLENSGVATSKIADYFTGFDMLPDVSDIK